MPPGATRRCSIAWSTSARPRPTTGTARSPTTTTPTPSARPGSIWRACRPPRRGRRSGPARRRWRWPWPGLWTTGQQPAEGSATNAAGAARLSEAARVADPDPWRKELRTALDQADKAARLTGLQALAKTAKFEELGAISLNLLGTGLNAAGDSALAESVLRTAQQRHPRDVWINYDLGQVLEKLSRRDEAIRFYTAARAIRPETAHELAHALDYRGDSDEAIAVFRDLKGLRPGNSRHLLCLAKALKNKGLSREADETYEAAAVAAREAIRLKPDNAEAHFSLGAILCDVKHDYPAAEAAFRQAIRLQPDHAETHYNLGNALADQGKRDEAIAEYRTAIRLQPDHAEAHCSLGFFLQQQGDYTEALEMLRKGHELGSRRPGWRYPSAQWVAEAERMTWPWPRRFPALLTGEDARKTTPSAWRSPRCALRPRSITPPPPGSGPRRWRADPKLGDDRQAGTATTPPAPRALAAAGQGKDDPPPDDAAKAKLRGQALDWLKAELTTWTKLLESGPPEARPTTLLVLNHWKLDSDLAGIRDAEALAKLPADEQKAWRSLWADVDSLLKRAATVQATEKELAGIQSRARALEASKPGEAERLFREATELARKQFGPADPRTSGALALLGNNLLQQGQWSAAEPVLRDCLAIREKSRPDDWTTFNTRSLLGASLVGQKQYVEAEPLILSGYEGMKARQAKIPPPGMPRFTEAAERVVKLYEAWGKKDKAAEWRAKLPRPSEEPKPQP